MSELITKYLAALGTVKLLALSEASGRHYRTLQAYKRREINPSDKAVSELIHYLRRKAASLSTTADELSALREEKEDA